MKKECDMSKLSVFCRRDLYVIIMIIILFVETCLSDLAYRHAFVFSIIKILGPLFVFNLMTYFSLLIFQSTKKRGRDKYVAYVFILLVISIALVLLCKALRGRTFWLSGISPYFAFLSVVYSLLLHKSSYRLHNKS